MKYFCIEVRDNEISKAAAERLRQSTLETIEPFYAFPQNEVHEIMDAQGLKWNYPWEGKEYDEETGLTKTAYRTSNRAAIISCALSHYRLWSICANGAESFVILEHDALFQFNLDLNPNSYPFDIIGLNDPFGATRKSRIFHDEIQSKLQDVSPVPIIDDMNIPQGIAGNSAYIIRPRGAKNLVKAVRKYGLWPNDAIMCQQLIPNMGVSREYYTKIQGTRSTTTS